MIIIIIIICSIIITIIILIISFSLLLLLCLYNEAPLHGVPIDVASHEPPSFSVLGRMLGLLEGESRPSGYIA